MFSNTLNVHMDSSSTPLAMVSYKNRYLWFPSFLEKMMIEEMKNCVQLSTNVLTVPVNIIAIPCMLMQVSQ